MPKNTMILYGKNSVCERLRSNSKSIKRVFLAENFSEPHIEKLIKRNDVACSRVSSRELAKMRHVKDLQGIVAQVESFTYFSFDDLLISPQSKRPTIIFLDRINDPQNLGVIIRTAACFGRFAVVIPKFQACSVTESVLHVASGGENYIPVSMVSNLSNAVISAKKSGYWVAGAILSEDTQDLNTVLLPYPLGLVLGSEGEGVRYGLDKHLDIKLRIPMKGAQLSFNVAMACAIICYEITRQRAEKKG